MSRRLALLLCVFLCAMHAAGATQSQTRLPISFEPHDGPARFIARGLGYSLFISDAEAVAVIKKDVVRIAFSGAHRPVSITGEDPLPGRANYFIGSDPSKWRTGVPMFRRVVARDVYDGIDLVYYGSGNDLEYDFIVHPGADPNQIRLSFAGADRIEHEPGGDLVLHLADGTIRQHLPVVYQEDGTRLHARYKRTSRRTFAFDIAHYDRTKTLVIDPTLAWSTYLKGKSNETQLTAIAVDGAGNTYVAGFTGGDVLVAKLDPTGSSILYLTYLGGSDGERANAIAVNAAGEAFVAGSTYSADFPTTPHAFQTIFLPGGSDGFVTRIGRTGNALIYSTLIGRSSTSLSGIAVDTADNAHVAGSTDSPKYQTIGAIQSTMHGSSDAVYSVLNATGTGLLYSTYLGGSAGDGAYGIVVDSSGNSYLAGGSSSSDFPTTPGSFQPSRAGGGWVAKFSAANDLVYSTYIGPASGQAFAVDSDGNAYVAGSTRAVDVPVTPGVLKPTPNGSGIDSFVTKLNPSGTGLVYSTYLGGSNDDAIFAIDVDAAGNAYVSGQTLSADFPVVNALQPHLAGISDAFVTEIDPAGRSILFSTFLGGSNHDIGGAIHVDAAGDDIRLVGFTYSSDFPTVRPLQPGAATAVHPDGFVATFAFDPPDLSIASTHAGDFVQGMGPFRYTIRITNVGAAHTGGTVTVTDTLPAGMTATSMSGNGWTCDVSTTTCTTAVAITAGSSYPDITLTVSVSPSSQTGTVSNFATVSGGGERNTSNDTAADATIVLPAAARRRSVRHD